jgi:hypothetical protein
MIPTTQVFLDRHNLQLHLLRGIVCLAAILFGNSRALGTLQSSAEVCHGQNGCLPYLLAGNPSSHNLVKIADQGIHVLFDIG